MELEIKGLKISHKLALVLMSTALLTMSIIGLIYHQQSQSTMEKLVEEHVNLLGSQIRSHLEKAVEQTNERIALISSRTQLRLSLKEYNTNNSATSLLKISKIINDAKASISDIQFISIYDVEETLISATSVAPYVNKGNLANRPKINFVESNNKEIIVDTFVPLTGELENIGYINIQFNFGLFGEALTYKNSDGKSQMYDAMLIILEDKGLSKTVVWQDNFKLTQTHDLPPIIQEGIASPKFREIELDNKQYFSNTFVLPEANLALIYKVDKSVAFSLIKQQITLLTYAILLLLFILMVVAYFAGKRISKPVVNMAFVAYHIAKGDLGKRIEKVGNDELSVLGRTLNVMAENLASANLTLENRVKSKTEELQKANQHLTELSKKLEALSLTDDLTKLGNRRALDEKYRFECSRASRDQLPLTVMMLDVDYFKRFNDTYGHHEGDCCLKKIAAVLVATVSRESDFVARYGGEEFAINLPNTNFEAAHSIANELLAGIRKLKIPNKYSDVSDYVTSSIGSITTVPQTLIEDFILINKADEALYTSKNSGRNKFKAIKV